MYHHVPDMRVRDVPPSLQCEQLGRAGEVRQGFGVGQRADVRAHLLRGIIALDEVDTAILPRLSRLQGRVQVGRPEQGHRTLRRARTLKTRAAWSKAHRSAVDG